MILKQINKNEIFSLFLFWNIKASECSEGEMFLFGKKNTSLEDHFIAPHKIQPKRII